MDQSPPGGRGGVLGEQAAQISREMVQLLRKTAGRGPTRARTTIARDHVVVMFRDTLTDGEHNLVANGHREQVRSVRRAYQEVMESPARETVERVLGRRVIGFMSANHFMPDLAAEIFILEPSEDLEGTPQEAEYIGERTSRPG